MTPVRTILQLLGHAIVLTMPRLAGLVRAHPDATSVVALILLSFLALGRALLPGKVLSAADILFLDQPWKSLAPDLQPGNPLLSDAAILFQPWLIYAAGEIGQGRIPLWNPHVFAGSSVFSRSADRIRRADTPRHPWKRFRVGVGAHHGSARQPRSTHRHL
jgi:hypothetical protein